MPDYAPNYTPRVKLRYSCQGRNHVLVVRAPRDTTTVEALAIVEQLGAALTTFGDDHLYVDFATTGWEYAAQDTTIFLPLVTAVTVTGAKSAVGRPINQIAMQMTMPYRTDSGGHGFLCLYGTDFNVYGSTEQDFRVLSNEDLAVETLHDSVQLIALVGGDNANPVFKPYVNIGFNARWKRRVRNG